MHDHRDGDERLRPSSPAPGRGSAADSTRLEEIGDLHFHASAFASAVDYYRSALRAQGSGAPSSALELHLKLADCLRALGQYSEVETELATAEELGHRMDQVALARVQVRRSQLRYEQGRFVEAQELALRAFESLSVTDRHHDVASAQMVMGLAHAFTGQTAKAEEFFQDALATYRRIGDLRNQAHVLNNLAILAKRACRWSRALHMYERAEELLRRHGAVLELGRLLLNKAIVFRKTDRLAEAEATALQGLRMSRDCGSKIDVLRDQLLLGQIHIDQGSLDQAEPHLLEAKVAAERLDARRELALADEFLGDLMRARGHLDEAEVNYELAAERARRISPENDILAELLRRRAEIELQRGNSEDALELAEQGLRMVESVGEEFERAYLDRVRGAALAALGQEGPALAAQEKALESFRRFHLTREVVQSLHDLAETHLLRAGSDDTLLARGRLQEACRVGERTCGRAALRTRLLLARVELELGNHEEALISLFELEQSGCEGFLELQDEVEGLRAAIEGGLASQAHRGSESYQMLADLPDLLGDEDSIVRESLEATLRTTARHLGAERGCVAVRSERGRVEVQATWEIPRTLARTLAGRALELLRERGGQEPRVWTYVPGDGDWRALLGDGKGPHETALALPVVADDGEVRGVFFFDADRDDERGMPFGLESLAMASTYVELLRSSLLRQQSSGAELPAGLTEGPFSQVITQNEKVMEVLHLCSKVAQSPYTVLFTGETGTGKGLLANLVHQLSPRARGPFVTVNCAAIPDSLLESELFGHVKGAFTGADREKEGLVVAARKGTLFLDEIGKMPLPMQAKLLQFLDTHEVRPVGGTRTEQVDVRVLCATKRDLERMVEREEFLEDLYYRLLDFPIPVPALRERGDDVLLLADYFVERTAVELGRPVPRMTRAFTLKLRGFRWPGNVRELEKVIRRAVLLAAGEERLRDAHLPETVRGATDLSGGEEIHGETRPLRDHVADLERHVIQSSLDRLGWNRAEAARQLKISYPTLLQKIRLYKLTPV